MALCTRCGRQTEDAAEFCSGCASYPGSDGTGRPQAVHAASAQADYLRPFAPESSGSPPLPDDDDGPNRAAPRDALSAPAESEEWPFPSPSGRLPDFPPLPRVPYGAASSDYEPNGYPRAPAADTFGADDYRLDSPRPSGYRPASNGADGYGPASNGAGPHRPDSQQADTHQPDRSGGDTYRPDSYPGDTYRPDSSGADAFQADANRAGTYRTDGMEAAPRGPFTPASPDYPAAEPFLPAPEASPARQDRPGRYIRPSGLLPGSYVAGDVYPAPDGLPASDNSPGSAAPAARLQWAAAAGQLADPLGSGGQGYERWSRQRGYDDQSLLPGQSVPGQTMPAQAVPGLPQPGQPEPGQPGADPAAADLNLAAPTMAASAGQAPAATPAPGQAAMEAPAWTAQDQVPAARLPLDRAAGPDPSDTGILREPGWRAGRNRVPPGPEPAAAAPGFARNGSQHPPRARGQHNGRWVSIAAAAAVLVICVVTAAVLLSRHKPADKGSPRATSTHSPRASAAPVVNGLVTIEPSAAGESTAPAVVGFLAKYFTAINHHDFAAYRRLFSTSLRGGLSSAAFGRGYGTSRDSLVTLHSVSSAGTAELDAAVTFSSRQQPADSPTHSACTAWVISLYLIKEGRNYVLVSPPAGYQASFSDCS